MSGAARSTRPRGRRPCRTAAQELKDEIGLDHFEGRSLPGWQRHVVLTAIAYSFLQRTRATGADAAHVAVGARRHLLFDREIIEAACQLDGVFPRLQWRLGYHAVDAEGVTVDRICRPHDQRHQVVVV